eukprot:Rmarinus@m.19095
MQRRRRRSVSVVRGRRRPRTRTPIRTKIPPRTMSLKVISLVRVILDAAAANPAAAPAATATKTMKRMRRRRLAKRTRPALLSVVVATAALARVKETMAKARRLLMTRPQSLRSADDAAVTGRRTMAKMQRMTPTRFA